MRSMVFNVLLSISDIYVIYNVYNTIYYIHLYCDRKANILDFNYD